MSATWLSGVNKITQATPTYFLIVFVIAFKETFQIYYWNIFEKSWKKSFLFSYYFIKIHVKNLPKNDIHLQVLFLFKSKHYSA
jgi:hypothetical protein